MSEHLDELGFYPHRVKDRLRYGDTDRQGHVNNAVFSTLLETGRVAILYDKAGGLASKGCAFVIARLEIDFRAELNWPGEIVIGTAVAKIGRSSFDLSQALFQDAACAAVSRSVIVQMDESTRRSHPLSEQSRSVLSNILIQQPQ
ncbi:acyl-CoA thioesterase [Tianweitania populi]|uniref:Thioesterase n=1 Tax=Tianweitania populi TaxID=1607949 RepID=A0A8J3GJL7_9HYPH|nr:thioesterase family protein [Tianweitania populi]GHD12695.1 thioesterase [Tianweitania populi]